jgi:hypothetical protein
LKLAKQIAKYIVKMGTRFMAALIKMTDVLEGNESIFSENGKRK